MKIKRKELLDALRLIRPGIDDNSTNINGMDCFIFMDHRVHSHDDAVSFSTPTEIGGEFAVSAIEFYTILSRFSKEDIEAEFDDKGITMKCGRAKANILYRTDEVSKRIKQITPDASKWKKLPPTFMQSLNLLHIRNMAPEVSAKLGGAFFYDTHGFATDNNSVIMCTYTSSLERMWIPPRALSILCKLEGLCEYCIVDSWLHFRSGEVTISCRKNFDERYPYVSLEETITSMNMEEIRGVFSPELVDVINRASVFGKDKDRDHTLYLTFEPNFITISSKNSMGAFEEKVPCTLSCKNPGTVAIGAYRLKQTLAKWQEGVEFDIAFNGDNPLLVFTSPGYREVLCLYK